MVAMQPILDVGKGLLNSTKTTIQDPKVQTSIVALEAVETSPECNKFMAVTFTILARKYLCIRMITWKDLSMQKINHLEEKNGQLEGLINRLQQQVEVLQVSK